MAKEKQKKEKVSFLPLYITLYGIMKSNHCLATMFPFVCSRNCVQLEWGCSCCCACLPFTVTQTNFYNNNWSNRKKIIIISFFFFFASKRHNLILRTSIVMAFGPSLVRSPAWFFDYCLIIGNGWITFGKLSRIKKEMVNFVS